MDSLKKEKKVKQEEDIKNLKEELQTWEMINSKDASAESDIGAGIMYIFFKIKRIIKKLILG